VGKPKPQEVKMKRAKSAQRMIGVIAAVLVLGGIGWAETGTISGTVRDKDTGEPLPGASVIVEGTKLRAIADREGRYSIDVPVGIYSVTVRMVGYAPLTQAGVEVKAGRKTTLDFELSPRLIRLKEIVVTATKLEEKVEDLPVSASVVGEEDIREMRASFADEALKYVPAAYLKRGKFTATTSNVTLRGFPGEQKTLVLLDGAPLNDAYGGSLEWSAVPLNMVQKVEVVKGPFSGLYGGYAMGGVINFITRTPEKRQVSVETSYGSHNTFCQYISYSDKVGSLGFTLYGAKKWREGRRTALIVKGARKGQGEVKVTGYIETKDKYGRPCYIIGDAGKNYWDQIQYGAKFSVSPSEGSELSLLISHSWRKYGYRGPRSYLRDENGNPVMEGKVDLGGKYISIKPYKFLKSWGVDINNWCSLRYNASLGEGAEFTGRLGINENRGWWAQAGSGATEQGGPGKLDRTDPNRTVEGELKLSLPLRKATLTAGLNLRWDRAVSSRWELLDWLDEGARKTRDPIYRIGGRAQTAALYAQVGFKPTEKLSLFAGGRLDWWRNYDASLLDKGNLTRYPDRSTSHFSPKVGVVYKPGFVLGPWNLKGIRASWGTAFRPPTVYELYKTWSFWGRVYEANPDLSPETSTSWEVGSDQTLLGAKVSVTYYRSVLENLIYYKLIAEKHKKRENAGKGEIRGIELEATRSLTSWLDASWNFTYQHTEITENPADPASVGKQFQLVPEKMHNLTLLFHRGNWRASLAWHYVSKVYSTSDNSDTEQGVYGSYDPVDVLDAKINYALTEHLELSLAVDNLLDREYYQYYKAPGRSFFVQGEYRFR